MYHYRYQGRTPNSRKWWNVLFRPIDHCSFPWLYCWAGCWMLQDMDNMEASFVFYVEVGMFTHLEHIKNALLTFNKMEIVRLTVHHDLIASFSCMQYPEDSLRQTSADIFSPIQWPLYFQQSCNFSCRAPRFIPVPNHRTSHLHIAHCGAVGNPCNLQLYAAGFVWSIWNFLAATDSIRTWS